MYLFTLYHKFAKRKEAIELISNCQWNVKLAQHDEQDNTFHRIMATTPLMEEMREFIK